MNYIKENKKNHYGTIEISKKRKIEAVTISSSHSAILIFNTDRVLSILKRFLRQCRPGASVMKL